MVMGVEPAGVRSKIEIPPNASAFEGIVVFDFMVPQPGLEPGTLAFSVLCSTD